MSDILWAGSLASYQTLELVTSRPDFKGFEAASISDDKRYREALVTITGDVAVINVSGTLVSGSSGYEVMYGVTGYEDIKAAALWAAAQPQVKALVYNVDSGGGDVAGANTTSSFISKLSTAKPSVTFTDGHMASAAAWLGTSTDYVIASDTAIVGSIGVLSLHSERTKMLDAMGIKVTVTRAGTEKALANPYEVLSEKAKENLQDRANDLYDAFISRMAENRGLEKSVAESKFGQGREFVGHSAKKAGLVDAIGTIEDAITKAQKLGANIAKVKGSASRSVATMGHNLANSEIPMPITTLSDDQLAALANTPVAASAQVETPEPAAPVSSPVEVMAAGAEPSVLDRLVSTLEALTIAKSDCEKYKADLATVTAQSETLLVVARQQVKTLGLHFGVQASTVDSMNTTTVLAEYERLSALFVAKFPGGRVAAPTAEAKKPEAATLDPLLAARLVAAKSR